AGVGAKYRAGNGWGVRLDARAMLVPSSKPTEVGGTKGGFTADFELLLGVYREFGRPGKVAVVEAQKPKKDEDPDKDGVLGDADKCPTEAEDKDGFEDDNGCPDLDNDADGVPDAADKCIGEAEDKDGFKDDDGCPDLDNDEDGVPDSVDKCVDQPETKNGFEDTDGCPDEVPAAVKAFTGAIEGITFKTGSVDLAPASNKVLDKAYAVLAEFKNVKLEIQGHTDDVPPGKTAKLDNMALSQGRADSVKAYFVKKGIEDGRLVAKGYGDSQPSVDPKDLKGKALTDARAKNRRVEFKLVSEDAAAAPAPTPAPTPAPKS
ncbi:MAG: OmpA family protein, partial [Proteobacteria bacterium]|nr:OmpA family protein [Pseudomonadota bacterium]